MFFDWPRIFDFINNILRKLWDLLKALVGGESSDSIDNSYSSFMVGLRNQIGDQIIGNVYIHKGDKFSVLQKGVDPRDLEKYLKKLDSVQGGKNKELQILDWYYTQDIDSALKDTLLLVVTKLPILLEQEKKQLTLQSDSNNLSKAVSKINDLAKDHKFERFVEVVDEELSKLIDSDVRAEFMVEVSRIYISIQQFKKGLEYLELAYNAQPSFEILRNVVSLYKQLDNYEKVIALLTPYQMVDDLEERLFVLVNLGFCYNNIGKLRESETVLQQAIDLHAREMDDQYKFAGYHHLSIYRYLIYSTLKKGEAEKAQKYLFSLAKVFGNRDINSVSQVLAIPELSETFLQVGVLLGNKNDWENARKFFKARLKSLDTIDEPLMVLRELVSLYTNLVVIEIYENRTSHAQEYISKLTELIDRFGVETKTTDVFLNTFKGLVGMKSGDVSQGYVYLNRVFESLSSDTPENSNLRAFVYAHIANVFADLKEYEKSKYYYSKAVLIMDELLGIDNSISLSIQEKIQNITLSNFKILIIV